jgi:hypothetical protein
MDINITHMVDDSDDMPMLSGSRAELGSDAGRITWRNAVAYAKEQPLLRTAEQRTEARRWLKGFGAWSTTEIGAWSDEELNGLICQFIAGDIREMEAFDTIEEFKAACEAGTASGRIYQSGDQWFFYLGD